MPETRPPGRGVAVPRGLGAAGASGPVSEDPPLQRCPPTRIRPLPPVTAATASQPQLHPAPRAPTLPGAAQDPRALPPTGDAAAAPAEPQPKPLDLF